MDDPALATLRALAESFGDLSIADTIASRGDRGQGQSAFTATDRLTADGSGDAPASWALQALAAGAPRVSTAEPIGEGGMGVVFRGAQLALDRDVAVKRPASSDAGHVASFVREAWVTAQLQHPNIVPVYDFAVDADGVPLLVLKRISGSTWDSLIQNRETVCARFGCIDPLEWHLRVLSQLCDAVEFAHSRGFLHRDLKPANVMIGEHGEVYLLDWGLAVSISDDHAGRVPLANEVREPVGTPAYMAPEMLSEHAGPLSVRSDVYLLGAVLYEVLTGRPPHGGESLVEVCASILRSEPEADPDAPDEMMRFALRCLSRSADSRPASAAEVRTAVADFIRHLASMRTMDEATTRLAELQALVDGPETDELTVIERFGQCRFGFETALSAWPENARARQGLDAALSAAARHALWHGRLEEARTLIDSQDVVDAALARQVEAALVARHAREQSHRQLRALGKFASVRASRRARRLVIVGSIALLAMALFGAALVNAGKPIERGTAWRSTAAFAVVAAVVGVASRARLARTYVNQVISGTVFLVVAGQVVLVAFTPALGWSYEQAFSLNFLNFATFTAYLALLFNRALFVAALAYAAGFFASWNHQDRVFLLGGAAHAVLLVCVVFAFGLDVGWGPLVRELRRMEDSSVGKGSSPRRNR